MTVKTIIFDLGGVVVPENGNFIMNEFAAHLGVTRQRLDKVVKRAWPKATSGKMTLLQLCERIVKKTNRKIKPEDAFAFYMREYKKTSFYRNHKIISLIDQLKTKYHVVCLTNTETEIADFNKQNGLFDLFHKAYLSTELKTRKPKKRIYKLVLKDLKNKANEVVFIDDNQSYIDTANILGLNTILYIDYEHLVKELEMHSVTIK